MDVVMIGLTIGLFLFVVAGVVGLIKPDLVKQKTRGKAFLANTIPAFVIFVVIGIFSPDTSVGIDYKVTKDEAKGDLKRTVEIVLPERVDESTLKALAKAVHEDGFERTFIGYRLEGQEGGAYWATTNYNPDLEISFLGSEKQSHDELKSSEIQVEGKIVGRWLVDWGYEYKAAIYQDGNKVMMKTLFSDGSGQDTELAINQINGKTRYYGDGGDERGEYYVIATNGNLQFWSENGNYYTAPKID